MAKKEVAFMNHPDPRATTSYGERNDAGVIEVATGDVETMRSHGFVLVDGEEGQIGEAAAPAPKAATQITDAALRTSRPGAKNQKS